MVVSIFFVIFANVSNNLNNKIMDKSKKIKIGSKVSYKGAWGTKPEKEVIIETIEKCAEEGMKEGIEVEEIDWSEKNYGVYDLSDGHWCYGYQIISLIK